MIASLCGRCGQASREGSHYPGGFSCRQCTQSIQRQQAQLSQNQTPKQELREKIFQGVGEASVCWDTPEGAGAFDSDKAVEIGEKIVDAAEYYADTLIAKGSFQIRMAAGEYDYQGGTLTLAMDVTDPQRGWLQNKLGSYLQTLVQRMAPKGWAESGTGQALKESTPLDIGYQVTAPSVGRETAWGGPKETSVSINIFGAPPELVRNVGRKLAQSFGQRAVFFQDKATGEVGEVEADEAMEAMPADFQEKEYEKVTQDVVELEEDEDMGTTAKRTAKRRGQYYAGDMAYQVGESEPRPPVSYRPVTKMPGGFEFGGVPPGERAGAPEVSDAVQHGLAMLSTLKEKKQAADARIKALRESIAPEIQEAQQEGAEADITGQKVAQDVAAMLEVSGIGDEFLHRIEENWMAIQNKAKQAQPNELFLLQQAAEALKRLNAEAYQQFQNAYARAEKKFLKDNPEKIVERIIRQFPIKPKHMKSQRFAQFRGLWDTLKSWTSTVVSYFADLAGWLTSADNELAEVEALISEVA